MEEKVSQLIGRSKEVFEDSSLENGAIVAINSGKPYMSKDVPNYMFVYPRDSAFIAYSMLELGMHEKVRKFFEWCEGRGTDDLGMLWQSYAPNGQQSGYFFSEFYSEEFKDRVGEFLHPKTLRSPTEAIRGQLQPDGNALLLWVLEKYLDKFDGGGEFEKLICRLADGLCKIWDKERRTFKYVVFGPWEEKIGYPDVNLTYTIATSIRGLKAAEKLHSDDRRWKETRESMESVLNEAFNEDFPVVYGPKYKESEYRSLYSPVLKGENFSLDSDASMLFFTWPGDLVPQDRSKELLETIVEELDKKGGIIRYKGDTYDGIFKRGYSERNGGNPWPLLNFWISICLHRAGRDNKAEKHFNWVLKNVEKYIPEQLTVNGEFRGPAPLVWSHAMFVIASKELGYI